MNKRTIIITVVALAAVTGVGAALVVPALASTDKQDKTEQRIDVATDKVTRGDLTERVRAGGKLAYANSHAAGTTLAGTITWVPSVGTIITRGGELLRIDDQPVTVLFGEMPAWRAFGPDMADGRDVRQLEENLRELGFFDGEPDEEFTWRTAEAIRDWQESRGQERTGELPLGSIVFTSGDVRVGAINSPVGSASSAEALTLTDPHQQITIDLDADLAAIVAEGATVSVSLPGGSAVEATITSIGAPVQKEGENGDKVMKIPLVLTPKELPPGPSDVTVSATFTRTLASNVLRVPVLALLAGPDSKTQVEVMAGKKSRTVDVTLGAFGDGFVEITGGDITEGDTVVVAQ